MIYRFTDEHKSLSSMPPRQALVAVRPDGYRDLSMEQSVGSELLSYSDAEPIVRLDLDPEGVEFLLRHLPRGDGFTEHVRYRRELAKLALWDQTVDPHRR